MPKSVLIDNVESLMTSDLSAMESVDLSEALSQCRMAIREGIRRGFSAATDVQTGQPWAPRKHPYPHPPLMKTQTMANAAAGIGSGSISEINGRTLRVGVSTSAVPYAPYHQFGTGRMVARPYVGASDETLAVCGEFIADAGLAAFS